MLNRRDTDNLQNLPERLWQVQPAFCYSDEQVGRQRGPDLDTYAIERRAVKAPQAQVLFYPAKEQLDGPASAIDLGDDQGGELELVRDKDERLAGLRIDKTDPAKLRGARHPAANAHVVRKCRTCAQAGLDSSQAFPVGQLGKNHRRQMIVGTKCSGRAGHRKPRGRACHLGGIQACHDLSEDRRSIVHFRAGKARKRRWWSSSKTPLFLRYSMELAIMQNPKPFLTGQP